MVIFDFTETSEAKKHYKPLTGKYKHRWVEESFNSDQSDGKQSSFPGTNEHLGLSILDKKVRYMLTLFLFGLLIIVLRLFQIQIANGEYYRGLAEGNRIRLRPIQAERGIIFDRNGVALVENVPNFSLSVVPQDLPRDPVRRYEVVKKISEMSGVPQTNIENLLRKYKFYSFESLIIKENLDYDTALKLYIQNTDLPGILIEKGVKRHYLGKSGDNGLSHLLGYLSKLNDDELSARRDQGYQSSDYIGRTGLEKQYETILRGIYGKKKIEVNAIGKEQSVIAEEAPVPGDNLYLTLDLNVQKKLEELLAAKLKNLNKTRAAAVALDPVTGGILAMVSQPGFDNNAFAGGIDTETYQSYLDNQNLPLLNRATAGLYPSGSTVKLIIAAAALQEDIISENTTILSTGGLNVGGHLFKDWKAGGHGLANITEAIAWSINTFFYYIGGGYNNFTGLGVDKIVSYMEKFNLGKELGVDLPGEQAGFIPNKKWKENATGERWYVGDTYNLSIGQGNLLVTPLQVSVWTATMANGGRVVRPHFANRYLETSTHTEISLTPEPIVEGFISEKNIRIVKEGMGKCVTLGSCQLLQFLPFSSGGKTGTAQWSSNKDDHAWFTGFAPYDNPRIVITILVEEGKEGATAALPVARDFLAWWGEYAKIK